MTSKVDNFGLIIDNFSSLPQQAVTENFTHLLTLTKSKLTKNGSSLVPLIDYSGANLAKLSTAMKISTGDSYSEYTNYEKIKIKSIPVNPPSNADIISFTYEILDINQDPYNSVAVSHDDFEKMDPNYNKDELEFLVSLSSEYSVSIVFVKAPPANKVRYPELFNETIHSISSFWDYSSSDLTELCESDMLKCNERVAYIRIRRGGSISTLATGSFKDFTLTSIGKDGRYVLKSDVLTYLANAKVSLDVDENGYIYNELKYPIKGNNSIVDISKINKHNKLYVKFNVEINSDAQSSQIIASIVSEDNTIYMTSESIAMPYYTIADMSSSINVSSKIEENDITISTLEVYTDVVADTVDPLDGGRYAPPVIYLTKDGNIVLDSTGTPLYLTLGESLEFKAIPSHRNVPSSQIWISLNGADFVNSTSISLTGVDKYKTHTFRAYVAGSGNIEQSVVVERVFTVYPVMSTPVFTSDIGSGSVVISATSEFDILYSTDGSNPDLVNRTNVALYTKPFKITKKTVIKAVSVFEDMHSEVVEYIFDPNTLFPVPTTLATITVSI